MTPFFKPFFGVALPTRMGTAIGKGLERVMLASVGGGAGIRKAFRNNPDGSTTMLSTRAGMPEFTTSGLAPRTITVSDSSIDEGGINIHTIQFSRRLQADTDFPFSLVDVTAIAGTDYISPLTDVDFSAGVTIVGGTITVPSGVKTFTASVTTLDNPAVSDPRTYEVHMDTVVAIGTIIDI